MKLISLHIVLQMDVLFDVWNLYHCILFYRWMYCLMYETYIIAYCFTDGCIVWCMKLISLHIVLQMDVLFDVSNLCHCILFYRWMYCLMYQTYVIAYCFTDGCIVWCSKLISLHIVLQMDVLFDVWNLYHCILFYRWMYCLMYETYIIAYCFTDGCIVWCIKLMSLHIVLQMDVLFDVSKLYHCILFYRWMYCLMYQTYIIAYYFTDGCIVWCIKVISLHIVLQMDVLFDVANLYHCILFYRWMYCLMYETYIIAYCFTDGCIVWCIKLISLHIILQMDVLFDVSNLYHCILFYRWIWRKYIGYRTRSRKLLFAGKLSNFAEFFGQNHWEREPQGACRFGFTYNIH